MSSNAGQYREPFQFALIHLFLFVSGVGAFLALERAAGILFSSLVLGIFLLVGVIILLRIENIVAGGIAGAAFAALFLIVLWIAVCNVSEWAFITASFVYPIIGYFVGIICAADRVIRSG
jgi:hypothetical protein